MPSEERENVKVRKTRTKLLAWPCLNGELQSAEVTLDLEFSSFRALILTPTLIG